MIELRTSKLVIRDTTYTVSEMTGKNMTAIRKLLETEKWRVESTSVSMCCVDPKFTEAEAANLPQAVVEKLSSEIFRLSREGEQKND